MINFSYQTNASNIWIVCYPKDAFLNLLSSYKWGKSSSKIDFWKINSSFDAVVLRWLLMCKSLIEQRSLVSAFRYVIIWCKCCRKNHWMMEKRIVDLFKKKFIVWFNLSQFEGNWLKMIQKCEHHNSSTFHQRSFLFHRWNIVAKF